MCFYRDTPRPEHFINITLAQPTALCAVFRIPCPPTLTLQAFLVFRLAHTVPCVLELWTLHPVWHRLRTKPVRMSMGWENEVRTPVATSLVILAAVNLVINILSGLFMTHLCQGHLCLWRAALPADGFSMTTSMHALSLFLDHVWWGHGALFSTLQLNVFSTNAFTRIHVWLKILQQEII